MRFFIYSTPRSGSAWLSNFLTYGGSFCLHDPLADGDFKFLEYPVSGAIDTGAATIGYKPPEGTRIFYLKRRYEDARESLQKTGWPVWDFPKFGEGFEFERLHDIAYLQDVWDQVTGLPFDKPRAEMLIEMNIQRDMTAICARVARRM